MWNGGRCSYVGDTQLEVVGAEVAEAVSVFEHMSLCVGEKERSVWSAPAGMRASARQHTTNLDLVH